MTTVYRSCAREHLRATRRPPRSTVAGRTVERASNGFIHAIDAVLVPPSVLAALAGWLLPAPPDRAGPPRGRLDA